LTGDDIASGVITRQYGDVFSFLSGRRCLDLTTTLQVRHRPTPIESLRTSEDVSEWIAQAGLGGPVLVDEAGRQRLLELREAIDQLFRSRLRGVTVHVRDTDLLNETARHEPLVPTLLGAHLTHHGDLDQVLSTLARDAIELFASTSSTARIRQCEHADCSRLFLDSSHAARRRWCGMSSCGNKNKSAAYRQRRAGGH
jgi:predicted RNA-binding Zn ribbon-like protein